MAKPRRHPALEGKPKGVWHADAVGIVPGYPATAEAYARRNATLKATSDKARAEGRTNRAGVPNGWGGRREEVRQLQEEAGAIGRERIGVYLRNSQLPEERLAGERLAELRAIPIADLTDAEIGALALAALAGMALTPAYGTANQLTAARWLLEFTVPKPTHGRRAITLEDALRFLDTLVETEPGV